MNLTSWDLSYPVQAIIVSEILAVSFLLSSVFITHYIYIPWLKRLEDEIEPEKYEDKYKLRDYWDWKEINFDKDAETNDNNVANDHTPEGNVFMKYNKENEGFEYWCDDKNIKYDYLDTVARKYCLSFNCCGIYQDRRKSIKDQKDKEEESKKEAEKDNVQRKDGEKEEEESIFVKQKKIDTKKTDRSTGEVALKSNKFIYKGKMTECSALLKKRDEELTRKTKKNMSFTEWMSNRS